MRKFLAVCVALFAAITWLMTFHPAVLSQVQMDQDGQMAVSIVRWGVFLIGSAITVGLWKWSNHDAQKKQAKMIADAIAASKLAENKV